MCKFLPKTRNSIIDRKMAKTYGGLRTDKEEHQHRSSNNVQVPDPNTRGLWSNPVISKCLLLTVDKTETKETKEKRQR